MSIRKKTYGFLFLIAVIAAAGYGITVYLDSETAAQAASADDQSQSAEAEAEKIPVEIAVASSGDISYSISSTANLRPLREVSVSAQTDGIVKEIMVEEGDYLQSGDLLCRLDSTKYEIQLQSARQKLAQAKLQLEKAKILQDKVNVQVKNTSEEFERYQMLYDEKLVSEREVADVRYRLDDLKHDLQVSNSESNELKHRVEELEAEIAQVELEISRTRLKAPFAGFVVDRSIDVGQSVNSLDTLFKLGDFNPLLAEVFLSEKEAGQIREGQKATVISGVDSSVRVEGKVARISPVVDESTGTVKVTTELRQSNSVLKPGAFVRVNIQTDTHSNSVLIPKKAILEEDSHQYVFVAKEDTVEKVRVETGYENEGEIEVVTGVSSGDSVVVAGQGALKEDSRIRRTTDQETPSET
jgi:membrane fusion protein (multidrug efflux system)